MGHIYMIGCSCHRTHISMIFACDPWSYQVMRFQFYNEKDGKCHHMSALVDMILCDHKDCCLTDKYDF